MEILVFNEIKQNCTQQFHCIQSVIFLVAAAEMGVQCSNEKVTETYLEP
jgi:hypothetical protein